jgi:hypothetical protein
MSAQPSELARSKATAAGLCGLIALFLAFSIQKIWDVDLWWQIRTGQWIADHRSVPSHDVFSYTATDHPWIEMRWLYCLFAYAGWSVGGPALLILCKTAALAVCFLILVWDIRAVGRTLAGIVVITLAITAASGRFVVRPELVTFVCLSVFLVVLDRRKARGGGGPAWILVALQALWVNSHTLFVLGPVVCVLRLVGDLLQRRWVSGRWRVDRGLLVTTAGVALACVINPYRLRGAMFPLILWREIGSESVLGETISELRSPLFLASWGVEMWAAFLLGVIGAASFILNRRRLDVGRLLVFAACFYLACVSQRNVALLAIVSVWAVLRNLAECSAPHGRASGAHWVVGGLLAAGAWCVAADRLSVGRGAPQEFGFGVTQSNIPVSAARFLNEAGVQGNLFHSVGDGSYLTWATRDKLPVFVDGRLEVYGEEFIRKYYATVSADWDDFADRHGINAVLIGQSFLSPLIPKIVASRKWVLVHLDGGRLVFVREMPLHAELIKRYRIDPRKPWRAADDEPGELPVGWRTWFGTASRPWHSLGMVETFLMLGGLDNATAYLERGLEKFPDHPRLRMGLAAVRQVQGRGEESEALRNGISTKQEDRDWADRLEAHLLLERGRRDEACDKIVAMVGQAPEDAELHAMLGRVRFEMKQYALAAESFRRAACLSQRSTGYLMDLGTACERCGKSAEAINAYRLVLLFEPSHAVALRRLARDP